MIVNVWCLRHPEKEGDALTPSGFRQAVEIARYFRGYKFDAVYYSGRNRTRQTALTILGMIDELNTELRVHPGFDYACLEDEVTRSMVDVDTIRAAEEVIGSGYPTGYWHLMMKFAPAWQLRGQVSAAIADVAARVAREAAATKSPADILVCSHTPVIEAGVPDPHRAGFLGFGQGICFTVEVPADGWPVVILCNEFPTE